MSVPVTVERRRAEEAVRIAGARREDGHVYFTKQCGRTGALIRVIGDVDAANADQLVDQFLQMAWCEWLVLDLTTLEFMGTAGLAALRTINARCAEVDVRWALVVGHAASRMLAVCGHSQTFPTCESLTAALASVHKLPNSR
ncbi:STAS domain-containing protein [Mycobacterium sp. GA-1841]|uniref:STAS domain-containing protein n=1 Tax=Mycobacterium sp. GA-1841 TaxID=1834154 RepID=UPI00111567F4|nr:STAS domain-containing protein [Mycobacterium sp. GA-1841]